MALIVEDGKSIDSIILKGDFSVLSVDRLKILKAISKEPKYPAQIARELDMQVQSAYYHINLLSKAGLVKLVDLEEKNGAMAKKYGLTASAFSVVASEKWKPFSTTKNEAPKIFSSFIKSGFFDGKIVVGSPDPHGKYRASGSEYCSMELAMLLGSHASFEFPLYYLDTELKGEKRKENLIIIGGPKVNTFLAEINQNLPIKFDEQSFSVTSGISKKTYGENVGIIELIQNPFNKSNSSLIIAGSNHFGTRVAILALLTKMKEIEKGNFFDKKTTAKVVQGFDEDGDGIVDAVEFLE